MAKAFVIRKQGDNKVLKLENVKVSDPLDGEVQIEQTSIGVNRFDVHYRNGVYDPGEFPAILGVEACGVVTKVGPNAKYVKLGDKVAYGVGVIGAYTTVRNIPADLVFPMPQNLTEYEVLSTCTKGLMAHSLLSQVSRIPKGATVLVHGATGGVGHLLVQMAKFAEFKVIGTVETDEKAAYAKQIGCDVVINTKKQNFSRVALEHTNGIGVNIIFDCLGKKAFKANIKAISPTGVLACYGDVLGVVDNVNLLDVWEKSISITRPCLATLKARRSELVMSYAGIANMIREKVLKPRYTVYQFEDLPGVHTILEQNMSMGSLIVKV